MVDVLYVIFFVYDFVFGIGVFEFFDDDFFCVCIDFIGIVYVFFLYDV